MITIRLRQVNLPCSSVEFRLVSISDLLCTCSVDFCHLIRCNVGSEKHREGLSNPSILSMPWRIIFDMVNSLQLVENNLVITPCIPVCRTNKTVIAVQHSILLGYCRSTNVLTNVHFSRWLLSKDFIAIDERIIICTAIFIFLWSTFPASILTA